MKSSASSSLRSFLAAPALGLLMLGATACGPSFNAAYMATDGAGTKKATTFERMGEEIHCVIDFVGGDEDTVITAALTSPPESGLQLSDKEIYPRPTSDKVGPVHIDIQLFLFDAMGTKVVKGPWFPGDYEMALSIDGELEETLPFKVQ